MRGGRGLATPDEFDRALSIPVPWTRPVLTATLACLRQSCFCLRDGIVRLCTPHHLQHRSTHGCAVTEKPREQAHVPAEQPPPGQDPRLPSAHADPRRARHPGCSSPQGSLRTVRLRLEACCPGVIGCEPPLISPQSSGGHAEQADLVRAAISWWCMPTRPTRARVNRHGSVLSCPRLWAMLSSATGRRGSYEP